MNVAYPHNMHLQHSHNRARLAARASTQSVNQRPQVNVGRDQTLQLPITLDQLRKAKRMIIRGLETVSLIFLALLLSSFYFFTKGAFPFTIVFIPLVLIYLRKAQLTIVKLKDIYKSRQSFMLAGSSDYQHYQRRWVAKCKCMTEYTLNVIMWLSLIVCIQVKIKLSPPVAIACLSFLQRFLWVKHIRQEFDSYTKKGLIVWKILVITQLANVFLKCDGDLAWKWEIVIWPIYIISSIALICSVSSLLICLGQLCNYLMSSNTAPRRPVYGQESKACIGVWVFYVINGFSASLIYTVLLLIQGIYFEKDNMQNNYRLTMYPAIYFFCLFVFSLVNFRNLQIWIIKNILMKAPTTTMNSSLSDVDLSRDESTFEQGNQVHLQLSRHQQQILDAIKEQQELKDSDSLEGTPRFLMHVSGSYFQTFKNHSKQLFQKLQAFGLYKQTEQDDGFDLEKGSVKGKKTGKLSKKRFQEKLEDLVDRKKPGKHLKNSQMHVDSLVLDDKVCFTDMNEDMGMRKKTSNDDMLKSKGIMQGDLQTGDQLFMDEAVASKYMLDKKLFINEMKTSIDDEQMRRNLRQQVANNSIHHIKRILLQDESSLMEDTYQEFKKDPTKFQQKFQGRLSDREDAKQSIKSKLVSVRRELKARLQEEPLELRENKIEAIQKECLICLDGKSDAVIMNCGHGGICFECSTRMTMKRADQKCHLCRKKIRRIFKIDIKRIKGSFIPVTQYLDLRGFKPELKHIKGREIDIESIDFVVNDEFMSDDEAIHIDAIHVHEQEQLFRSEFNYHTTRNHAPELDIREVRKRRFSMEEETSSKGGFKM